MEVLHTLSAASAAVIIVGILVWGGNSCSLQETALREACIKGGGSVIVTGGGLGTESHCVRGGSTVER